MSSRKREMSSTERQIKEIKRLTHIDQQAFLKKLSESHKQSEQMLLLHLLDDPSPDIRIEIVEVLVNVASPLCRIAARAASCDPTPLIRDRAAVILGQVGNSRDTFLLRQALTDRNWNVRSSAATSLGMIGGSKAFMALVSALEHEPNAVVKRDIALALSDIEKREAIPHLERALDGKTSRTARIGLLLALYKLGKRHYINPFLLLMRDEDELVRQQTINAITVNSILAEDVEKVTKALREIIINDENPGIKEDAEVALNSLITNGASVS